MAWFPMKENAMGATGSLVKGNGYDPSLEGVLIYFTAPDIEVSLTCTKEKGGKVIKEKTDTKILILRTNPGRRRQQDWSAFQRIINCQIS